MPTDLSGTDESFDWASYLDRYPDLRLAGIEDEAAATRHWLAYGRAEGRDGRPRPRAPSHSLACPSEASLYLRATGDLVCWDDAGNATVLQRFDATRDYAHEVWLGEPYEAVRRRLRDGRLPFPEVCARCLALRARPTFGSDAVARRRIEVFQLEPSYHCSLDCPGCVPLAVRRHAPPQHLEAGRLDKILSDLERAGITVGAFDFQGHGEPLLHPDVWGLARLVRSRFPASYLSMTTNAHGVVDPSRLAGSFDEIVCAIDGTVPETYLRYRIGGRFELAWRFLVDLAKARRATGSTPRVVWKYVLFAHNSSLAELEEARRRAVELGLDELRFVFTRNGPPAHSVSTIEGWLGDDDGPRISLQRHEPSPLELASRLAEAERRLDQETEACGEGAWELALSVGRNLERFFPDGEALPPSFAEVEKALRLTLGRLVEAESLRLPETLERFLPVSDDEGESRHRPSTVDAARTVDLIRESRRLLAYAPLVTGLRPVYAGADELYPQFVESAVGCELVDTTGRTLIDWMSGYGSVVLGYRDPEVEAAVVDQMRCGPVVPFGHPLEIEVARRLVEAIPCAESVGFGKNGSDAVTAAVRLARLATGREMVLYHGYHGFHDWFAAGNPAVGGDSGRTARAGGAVRLGRSRGARETPGATSRKGRGGLSRAGQAADAAVRLARRGEIGMRRPTPLSQYLCGLQVDGLGPRKEVGREEE
ncbi:MAG: aminotransferase class III-fold pyridoxal phosphate-dependent enzyme [Holophagales bacterium]|nr:MAG: aminotransferase class III-fold pyridoxal phosphate-dependent enzyme [Holophagales bacterium]